MTPQAAALDPGALLLADSRLPSGGHSHSGTVEPAVARGMLRDETDLALFLRGRVRGAGVVAAGVAAAACLLAGHPGPIPWIRWDSAVSARTLSAAAREASRAQGAALLRTARQVWPSPAVHALAELGRPHHPVVLGAVGSAAGMGAEQVAQLAMHHLMGGACSAAVRLLGLDPLAVAAVQARTGAEAAPAARAAAEVARAAVQRDDTRLLPSSGTPLPEVLAELHTRTEATLFAS